MTPGKLTKCSRVAAALAVAVLVSTATWVSGEESAPRIFLDKSPAVIKYQLKRLSNDQLLAVERDSADPKYRPVYQAILVRKGLVREPRHEALAALVKINGSNPVAELLSALAAVEPDDTATAGELTVMLLGHNRGELAAHSDALRQAAGGSNDAARRAAYAGLALADGKGNAAWELASEADALTLLLQGIGLIPDRNVRASFYEPVHKLITNGPLADEPAHIAAVESISHIPGHETETFDLLAGIIVRAEGSVRDAAIRSIRRIPPTAWPTERLGPLAQAVVRYVGQTPGHQRTSPAAIEAVQLGHELAGALPPAEGAPIRKALRELGVRVVLIRAIPEQMLYDLRYFTVEAGKPVQIVLENPDAMPHNLVITAPGSLMEVGLAAASLTPPAPGGDPGAAVKAYVPDSPKVLHATHLINGGESTTLSFDAPTAPGEYIYVCTYPGHFVRMYGVMLVVNDIEAWESNPKAPTDPLTGQPFTSPKTEPLATDPHHEH